jgi:hypothetical protein
MDLFDTIPDKYTIPGWFLCFFIVYSSMFCLRFWGDRRRIRAYLTKYGARDISVRFNLMTTDSYAVGYIVAYTTPDNLRFFTPCRMRGRSMLEPRRFEWLDDPMLALTEGNRPKQPDLTSVHESNSSPFDAAIKRPSRESRRNTLLFVINLLIFLFVLVMTAIVSSHPGPAVQVGATPVNGAGGFSSPISPLPFSDGVTP